MINKAISTSGVPKHLSADDDPLFLYHQWQANLRIPVVDEIRTIPYTPLSPPFIKQLIGTIRCEFLDRTLFWIAADLERKLTDFQGYTTNIASIAHSAVIHRLMVREIIPNCKPH